MGAIRYSNLIRLEPTYILLAVEESFKTERLVWVESVR